ncbi:hypothetical protein D3C84_1051390 [compost metagenome]
MFLLGQGLALQPRTQIDGMTEYRVLIRQISHYHRQLDHVLIAQSHSIDEADDIGAVARRGCQLHDEGRVEMTQHILR